MKLYIIVNLKSGNRLGEKMLEKLIVLCQSKHISYEVHISSYAGHAKILAKEIARYIDNDYKRIVILGGDGTLNEVVSSLLENHLILPVAYLPAGTGNDFARSVNCTTDSEEFLLRLQESNQIEREVLQYEHIESQSKGFAINSIGIGFDATVALLTNESKEKQWMTSIGLSKFTYLSQIMKALKKLNPFNIEIILENQPPIQLSNVFMISFMNHPYYGGGIHLCPYTFANSHEFGIVIAQNVTIQQVVKALYYLKKDGTHLEKTEALSYYSSNHMQLNLMESQLVQTDGESKLIEKGTLEVKVVHFPFWLT